MHRRLAGAASGPLPAHGDGRPRPWWRLPGGTDYLWRFLPHHLGEAGRSDELAALVCDPRWVEVKTRTNDREATLERLEENVRQVLTDLHRMRPAEAAYIVGAGSLLVRSQDTFGFVHESAPSRPRR